jgi:hypothetical protein
MSIQSQRENYRDAYLAVVNGMMRDHGYFDYVEGIVVDQVDRIAHGLAKAFTERMDNFNETMNEDAE